jgi:flagellin-like hook-associated protein FlgL
MASNITLSAGVRQNLLALQNTAALMATTQQRLATGKKVNSALDNPGNFFTSVSLQARAGDLSNLLDSMGNGIKTLEAADNGIQSIIKTVESMRSLVLQARQDKSTSITATPLIATGGNASDGVNNKLSFDLGNGIDVEIDTYNSATPSTLTAVGGTYTTDLSAVAFSVDDGNGADAITFQAGSVTLDAKVADINDDLETAGSTVIAVNDGGELRLVNATGDTITVAGAGAATLGFGTGNTVSTDGQTAGVVALADLVTAINTHSVLSTKVKASIDDNGDLNLENRTTTAITVSGHDGTDITGDAADQQTLAAGTVSSQSDIRTSLENQFNDLKTQLDQLAEDASFNGSNLLAGDSLTLNFNENGTSTLTIQGKNADGTAFGAITVSTLSLDAAVDFSDDNDLDAMLDSLSDAAVTLRSQASQYGTALFTVQNRQDFTKSMINTLQTGADNLVLADSNEESANLLALQTRQQLSVTALSLSAQADQAVLRLFG